jgi:hypothetical protein
MKINKFGMIMLLCVGVTLTACKGKNSAKADSAYKKVNLDTNSQGHLSDSTMGKVPDSSKDSTKNAGPGATGPKAHADSVMKK